jgi:soluble lytic murein transglycosylase-like protein
MYRRARQATFLSVMALPALLPGGALAKTEPGLDQLIAQHAEKQGVPLALARAVIRLESNFRPTAAHAGNYGLMQVRLATARSLGFRGDARGLLDARTNLTYGMAYLGQAWRLSGGDLCGAIARYQSGLRNTRINASNRAYCARARAVMARAG